MCSYSFSLVCFSTNWLLSFVRFIQYCSRWWWWDINLLLFSVSEKENWVRFTLSFIGPSCVVVCAGMLCMCIARPQRLPTRASRMVKQSSQTNKHTQKHTHLDARYYKSFPLVLSLMICAHFWSSYKWNIRTLWRSNKINVCKKMLRHCLFLALLPGAARCCFLRRRHPLFLLLLLLLLRLVTDQPTS